MKLTRILKTVSTMLLAVSCLTVGWAQGIRNFDLNGAINGDMYFRFLRFENSRSNLNKSYRTSPGLETVNKAWANAIGGRLTVRGQLNDRLSGVFSYGGSIWNLPKDEGAGDAATMQVSGGIDLGYGQYVFGDLEKPPFILKVGLFDYEYSPESKDLGEYLFSANMYPGFVISKEAEAEALADSVGGGYDMLGLHLRSTIVPNLTQDLIFHSVLNVFPNFDWCLGYVAHLNVANMLTVGAGVEFHRLIPVIAENTTSENFGLVYILGEDGDSATAERDTLTHRGVKCMARFAFDPKGFFDAPVFGKEDLKLYAEAAILGVRDQAVFYEDIRERIPVMVGVNIPTFKVLDYCAVEVEWYGSPHENYIYRDEKMGLPKPPEVSKDLRPGNTDDIKWAVTFGKEIISGLKVTGRVARDHYRLPDGKGYYYPMELVPMPENWYWSLVLSSSF